MDKDKLIIRKKTSLGSRLRRAILLILLWVIALYLVIVNVCFIFGIYSDALVVNYSLFNLSFRIYRLLGTLILVTGALISIYGVVHIRRLKRKAAVNDKNNA
ncbi:hypothetical protein AYR62_02610 [Secundilactobacillus paracollinoides]|uniref:Uncharacterized protein n=1 Tax=Secundilactobacillus paracollinoides TaxID=240427 RepID=A0A1B2IUN6_9LACO|nr:hypothetical protein [Secundilactobacillus paracollinoides]ANZ59949.1 hypothetical protein AYR61_00305 [Secundilactobacillus paracollinoides]ANZ63095.1 hypothetical protein AYR62_02610 [Secundilactobacillus paracollinoides]ANZ65740.1 hypothetical protein AYR63_00310 [Secundilactobacillus paracollinoides]KRL79498.1 hypothetical protein FC17_GL000420 [Secundilactobacillus paracollinoides DSM 15502 = JCM 11969]